jgi:hypothetical protein
MPGYLPLSFFECPHFYNLAYLKKIQNAITPTTDLICLGMNLADTAVVAQSLYCLTTDWMIGVRSSAEAKDFSHILCVQTSSEAHPAF